MRDVIRRLARPVLRLLGRDDRGAVGVLVGVLLGGGVLLGIGALVIDVGMLYQERAELQNGADAGALAVAKSCALGGCVSSRAASYADKNANRDGVAAVPRVCGSAAGGGLGGCPASTGTMVDCPEKPGSGNYVDVHTSTKESGGSTLLPPVLARALLGNAGYAGSSVQACARAAWGAPATASTFSLTISACEWDVATQNGTRFAPPPPYPPLPAKTYDQILTLHDPNDPKNPKVPPACPTPGHASSDGPGQFGWTIGSDCSTTVNNSTYGAKTGNALPSECKDPLAAAWTSRTPIFIPIYTAVTGNGSGGTYTLKGFAAFVVTGYALPGGKKSNWLDPSPSHSCTGSVKCVTGFFTQGLVPGGGTIGGPDLGATIIALTG